MPRGSPSRPGAPSAASATAVLSVNQRHNVVAHSSMMYRLQSDLCGCLRALFQEPDSAQRLHACQQVSEAVETLIKKAPIATAEEQAVWGAVPTIIWDAVALPPPMLCFGSRLVAHYDRHGQRRARPELLRVCDVQIEMSVRQYSRLQIRRPTEDRQPKTLRHPEEAISQMQGEATLRLYGDIFPTGCALGAVAQHLAEMKHDLEIAGDETRSESHQLFFMTDDRRLFEAMVPQYSGVLIEGDAIVELRVQPDLRARARLPDVDVSELR